jgi:hypothetical protein
MRTGAEKRENKERQKVEQGKKRNKNGTASEREKKRRMVFLSEYPLGGKLERSP